MNGEASSTEPLLPGVTGAKSQTKELGENVNKAAEGEKVQKDGLEEPRRGSSGKYRSSVQVLSESILKAAAEGGRGVSLRTRKLQLGLGQLRIADLRLHGREDDVKLLRAKLRGLKNASDDANDDETKRRPELLLVTGVSGTGKSALVMRGLRDPAQKIGMAFAGGKFDLNRTALPLSAFAQAMTSLAKFVVAKGHLQKVKDEIKAEFGKDDMVFLARVLAGCEELLPIEETPGNAAADSNLHVEGKEVVMRLRYSIRRLLKVICSSLKGVVLFIDDLQV